MADVCLACAWMRPEEDARGYPRPRKCHFQMKIKKDPLSLVASVNKEHNIQLQVV